MRRSIRCYPARIGASYFVRALPNLANGSLLSENSKKTNSSTCIRQAIFCTTQRSPSRAPANRTRQLIIRTVHSTRHAPAICPDWDRRLRAAAAYLAYVPLRPTGRLTPLYTYHCRFLPPPPPPASLLHPLSTRNTEGEGSNI